MAPVTRLERVIPVPEQPEPVPPEYDFDLDVRKRGEDAIRQLCGLPPLRKWPGRKVASQVETRDAVTFRMLRKYHYWTRAMPALRKAYGGYCAYHARYIEPVETPTTDHFVALKNATLGQAYEWSNYRLAGGYVNSVKSALSGVLDPFSIKDGWFAINFPTYKTIVGPKAPASKRSQILDTIERLKLDGPPLCETRRRAARRYLRAEDPLPLSCLMEDGPFLAQELVRQGLTKAE